MTPTLLTVHVKPNARENKVTAWLDDDTLKASVTAPPEKGKANEALLKLLARELNVPKSVLSIVRGHATRIKHVAVNKP